MGFDELTRSPKPQHGRFITFEGGEGSGKSTQIARLSQHLLAEGIRHIATREPGGTPGAECVRQIVLSGGAGRWTALGEMYLMLAARADHVERIILPNLTDGVWVLCDRFIDSTLVYQGLAGGLGLELVSRMHAPIDGLVRPDLTVLLDVPVEIGLERRRRAGGEARFEQKSRAFHEAVRAGYQQLAEEEPQRFVIIDASADANEVARTVADHVLSQ